MRSLSLLLEVQMAPDYLAHSFSMHLIGRRLHESLGGQQLEYLRQPSRGQDRLPSQLGQGDQPEGGLLATMQLSLGQRGGQEPVHPLQECNRPGDQRHHAR